MQHLQAKNLLSAEEYLLTSSQICESDPLRVGYSYFQKVVSMSPPNADALTALGYIYHVKEEFEEAIMYYHEVLYKFL
ncbi:ApcC hetero-tetramer Cut9-Hcn1 [Gigaspora margarita]|uniref:ApcC hetero-tetramer Cut9-Hcn1 n=1 Tax=Gigaspora margarita TaxID=4874 RepID=A0A8H3X444_GIGMA|nr:ApcC hetero-tetramer Cut9-Hcn1 [Gigaspora margarita]